MFHDWSFDTKFFAALAAIDTAYAEQVREAGCVHCEGVLDRADYPHKPRGELGEAASSYQKRLSFCCRSEGCRKRAPPPSLRFLGRRVYVAAVVVVASAAGRAMQLVGRARRRRIHGAPVRTVRRWHRWWQEVFGRGAFWSEAKAFFATPVQEVELPASLLARFGDVRTTALESAAPLSGAGHDHERANDDLDGRMNPRRGWCLRETARIS